MKKQLLAVFFSFATFFSFAQITINQSDYTTVGDTVIIAIDTLPSINVGNTGLQTWDFTTLQSHMLDTVAYIDPLTTPNGSDFVGSNLSLETPVQYEYYTSSSTLYTYDGFDGDPAGIGQNNTFVFSDKQILVSFPSTYNDSDVDTAYGEVKIDAAAISGGQVDSVWIKHTGYSDATMDAYGNLTLLTGTYNTLRQSGTEISIDSVYIYVTNALVAGFLGVPTNQWVLSPPIAGVIDQNPIVTTTYMHKWIANGEKHPLVEATMDALGGNATRVEFRAGGAVALNMTSTNISCFGYCNGAATATPTTGFSPYTYVWNDPMTQTTQTATGLCAGTYLVTVVDALGDSANGSMTLNNPAELTAETAGGYVQCAGDNNTGVINITPTGGTGPFTFAWDNASTSNPLTGLNIGAYTLTLTDASGCVHDTTFSVMNPDTIELTLTSTDIVCYGDSNGTATVTVTGGITPYSYLWNEGSITSSVNGLAGGNISVTVIDDLGCSNTASGSITENDSLGYSELIIIPEACPGYQGEGGQSPYFYLWSNGDTTQQSCDNPDYYSLTITDNIGCQVIVDSVYLYNGLTELINQSIAIYPNPTSGILTIEQETNLKSEIMLTDITGKQVYSDIINDIQNTIDVTHLTPGHYLLRIVNSEGTINRKIILTK